MKRKQVFIATIAVSAFVLLGGTFAFAKNTEAANHIYDFAATLLTTNKPQIQTDTTTQSRNAAPRIKTEFVATNEDSSKSPTRNNGASKDLPDFVTFDLLFSTVKVLDDEATKLESKGESGKLWREHYEREAGLTKTQAAILRQVSNEFLDSMKTTHQRVLQIINEREILRQTTQTKLPVSPELDILQKQREATALTYRDRLKALLGVNGFEKLSDYLKNKGKTSPLTAVQEQVLAERLKQPLPTTTSAASNQFSNVKKEMSGGENNDKK